MTRHTSKMKLKSFLQMQDADQGSSAYGQSQAEAAKAESRFPRIEAVVHKIDQSCDKFSSAA